MRLVDVLESCRVKTVTVTPGASLAVVALAMHKADAAAAMVMENGELQGILTAADILRTLTLASLVSLAWNGPVTAALREEPATATPEEPLGRTIKKMIGATTDHLPVITAQGIIVVSLSNLLLEENAHLHSELHHLQTYIDALHDAPND